MSFMGTNNQIKELKRSMYRHMLKNVVHGHASCMKVASALTEETYHMSEIKYLAHSFYQQEH
jgi:hypothetical protein